MSRRSGSRRAQRSKRARVREKEVKAIGTKPKGSVTRNLAMNLEDITKVKVQGVCRSGKLRYPDIVEAQKALTLAIRKRDRAGQARVEKRFYGGKDDPCGYGCGGYHLTSREAFEPRYPRQAASS